jgi:quinoprotein glucose dehydrogenase
VSLRLPVGFAFFVLTVAGLSVAETALAVPVGHPIPAPKKPTIAEKSDEPAIAAAAFGMREGFEARLFAAEPDVANPVAFSVDEKGRAAIKAIRQDGKPVYVEGIL